MRTPAVSRVLVRWSCGHRDWVDADQLETLVEQMELPRDSWGRPFTGRWDWQGMPLPRFECREDHENFEVTVVPMSLSFQVVGQEVGNG